MISYKQPNLCLLLCHCTNESMSCSCECVVWLGAESAGSSQGQWRISKHAQGKDRQKDGGPQREPWSPVQKYPRQARGTCG